MKKPTFTKFKVNAEIDKIHLIEDSKHKVKWMKS